MTIRQARAAENLPHCEPSWWPAVGAPLERGDRRRGSVSQATCYRLSKTIVDSNGLPAGLIPLVHNVIAFPSADITRVPA